MTDLLQAWTQRAIAHVTYLHRNHAGVVTHRVELDPQRIRPVIDQEGRLLAPPEIAWEYFDGGLHALSFTQDEIEIVLKAGS